RTPEWLAQHRPRAATHPRRRSIGPGPEHRWTLEPRRRAGISLADHVAQIGFRYRPRMCDLCRCNQLARFFDVALFKPEVLESGRQAKPHIEIVKPARGVVDAERPF